MPKSRSLLHCISILSAYYIRTKFRTIKELAYFGGLSLLLFRRHRCCRRHSPALLFENELRSCYLWLILILLRSIEQNVSSETLYAPHLGFSLSLSTRAISG